MAVKSQASASDKLSNRIKNFDITPVYKTHHTQKLGFMLKTAQRCHRFAWLLREHWKLFGLPKFWTCTKPHLRSINHNAISGILVVIMLIIDIPSVTYHLETAMWSSLDVEIQQRTKGIAGHGDTCSLTVNMSYYFLILHWLEYSTNRQNRCSQSKHHAIKSKQSVNNKPLPQALVTKNNHNVGQWA